MSSFLEKLKKGMGVEDTFQAKPVKKPSTTPAPAPAPVKASAGKKAIEDKDYNPPTASSHSPKGERAPKKKLQQKKAKKSPLPKKEAIKAVEPKTTTRPPRPPAFGGPLEKIEVKEEKESKEPSLAKATESKEKRWFEPVGELAVDVYQTNGEIVIQSAIAGVKSEDLDITIEKDMVTIKGNRERIFERNERNYFYQECYWGRFLREIILPAEVNGGRAEATMKEGVLTIRIPKIERKKRKKIVVKG